MIFFSDSPLTSIKNGDPLRHEKIYFEVYKVFAFKHTDILKSDNVPLSLVDVATEIMRLQLIDFRAETSIRKPDDSKRRMSQ